MSSSVRWGDVSDSSDDEYCAKQMVTGTSIEKYSSKESFNDDDDIHNFPPPNRVSGKEKKRNSSSNNPYPSRGQNSRDVREHRGNNRRNKFNSHGEGGNSRNHYNSNHRVLDWKEEARRSKTIKSIANKNETNGANNWMEQRRKKIEERERQEKLEQAKLKEEKRRVQMQAMKEAAIKLKEERERQEKEEEAMKMKKINEVLKKLQHPLKLDKEKYRKKDSVKLKTQMQKDGSVRIYRTNVK